MRPRPRRAVMTTSCSPAARRSRATPTRWITATRLWCTSPTAPIPATGLNPTDDSGSVGHALGQVDPLTGQFPPLVTAANAPDFHFGSAHGAAFVADKAAPPTAVADHISVLATAPAHSSGPDS